PSRAGRVELGQAQPRDDRDEVCAWRRRFVAVLLPAQPRVLNDVFGATEVAEHPISKRHERRAVLEESVGGAGGGLGLLLVGHSGFASMSATMTPTSAHINSARFRTRRITSESIGLR